MLRSTTSKLSLRSLNVLKTSVRCNSLVIIDPSSPNLNSITAAKKLNKPIDCLVVGNDIKKAKDVLKNVDSVRKVYFAENEAFKGLFPEVISPIILKLHSSNNYTHIISGASVFGKNLLPRVAAGLDVSPISEVIAIEDENTFKRNIYAGNAIETVKSKDALKVLTIRETAFEKYDKTGSDVAQEEIQDFAKVDLVSFVNAELTKSERPELSSATKIVSGGRGLKSGDNFKILYELADKIGAGVGASRAAVDAGFVTNDLQIGQTGKIVAPELYVAVGISGAIQHLAGMKDSKTIVAINKDPEAPIFHVSDLGLVEDLFKAVPEINSKIDSFKS